MRDFTKLINIQMEIAIRWFDDKNYGANYFSDRLNSLVQAVNKLKVDNHYI